MGGGRPAGARTKLATKFLWDLLHEWEEHGPGVLRICRIEKPVEFMKIVASTLPKEFALETGALADLSDDDLAAHLLILQKLRMGFLHPGENFSPQLCSGLDCQFQFLI